MDSVSLQAVITAKDSGYTKAMQNAEKASQSLQEATELTSASISKASAVGNLAANVITKAVGAVKNSVSSAVSRLDTLNNFPLVMQTLGYTAEEASDSISTLSSGIEGLPTTLNDIVSNAQMLTASLNDLESGTDAAVALNDMFLSGGQGAEAAGRALTQYNQILAKGKVDQQSWNTMVEVAPGQMNQLAQSLLGATANQKDLYEALKDGSISIEDFNNHIIQLDKEGGESFASFADQARAATGGIGTAWTNIQSAITKGVANVINAVNTAAEAAGLPTISESLEGVKAAINSFFSVASSVASKVTSAVAPVFKLLGENIGTVATVIGSTVSAFAALKIIDTVKDKTTKLKDAMSKARDAIDNYNKVTQEQGTVSETVAKAQEARKKATDLQKAADKAAQAATKAKTAADKAAAKAVDAAAVSEKAKGANVKANTKAVIASNQAEKAKAAAAKQAAAAEQANAVATQANATATNAESAAATVSNAQLSTKQILLGVLSGKLTVAQGAQMAFNAAMSANPIGLVITAISGLISVVSVLSSALGGMSDEEKAAQEAQKEFVQSCKDTNAAVKSTADEVRANVSAYDEQAATTNALVDEIEDLASKENKSASDKEKLATKVTELNGRVEDLNLSYDEEADKLSQTTDEIEDKVDAYEKLAKAQAIQDAYDEALDQELELQSQAKQLEEERAEIVEQLAEKQEEAGNAANNFLSAFSGSMTTAQMEAAALQAQLNEYDDLLAENNEAVAENAQLQTDYSAQIKEAKEQEAQAQQEAVDATVQALADSLIAQKQALDETLANGTTTLDMLSETNQETVEAMQEQWQGYYESATDMFSTLSDEQTMSVDQMIANLEENQRVINTWGENMTALRDRLTTLGLDTAVVDQLQTMGTDGAGYVAALVTASDEQLASLATSFGNGATTATDAFYNGLGLDAGTLPAGVENLVTQTETTLSETIAASDWSQLGSDVVDGLAEGLEADDAAVEAAKTLAEDSIDGTKITFETGSPSKVYTEIGKFNVQGLANGMKNNAGLAVTASQNLANRIITTSRNALVRMTSVGTYAMQGFLNGLNSMAGAVIARANSIATSVSTTIQSALQVHSPSRLLEKIGMYTGKGLALGLESTQRMVENASLGLAKAAAGIQIGGVTNYKVSGSLAFAGAGSFEMSGIREELESLKEALLTRPVQVDTSLNIDGRAFAKGTTTYISDEQNRRSKLKSYVQGDK